MDTQFKKGLLEFIVLAALRKNGDSYGYNLAKEFSEYIEMSQATIYSILRRLEKCGNLSVHSLGQNGRLRKYYHITDKGIERLNYIKNELKTFKKIYEDYN